MTDNKTIFVTGGTGNQGGAVAKSLVNEGFTVKVLTRNTGSPKALILKSLNIELVKGDLNAPDTFKEHLSNVYGVFSVQTFRHGAHRETAQGIRLAALAKEIGVKHFLYSSALTADLQTGIPHMDSKLKIETYIKQARLPFTIIRPASLYENFLIPQVKKGILDGKLIQPVNRDTILQYIASQDIGLAATRVFQNAGVYMDKTIPLATEQLSTMEVADIFSAVLNKPIEYKKLPAFVTRVFIGKSVYKMFKWMDEKNRFAKEDVDSTMKDFPGMLSLRTWISRNFKSL